MDYSYTIGAGIGATTAGSVAATQGFWLLAGTMGVAAVITVLRQLRPKQEV